MVILWTTLDNEQKVEIGSIEKSFAFSMKDIILKGLKNVLSEKFSEDEINESFSTWYNELEKELSYKELCSNYNEKVVGNLVYSSIFLDNLPSDSNYSVTLNEVNQYQKNLKNGEYANISKDFFTNFDSSKIELTYKEKIISCIKQKHKTSCTIACVAMVTGQDYDKVFKEVTKTYQLKRYFSMNEDQWREYLGKYNYSLGEKKIVKNWKAVPDYALCVVEGTQYNQKTVKDITHAIVFRRQHGLIWILDPGNDKPQYDFWNYNMRLKECYEIK